MGGSTNAMIHVVAMARRAGIPLDLDRFDELARQMPVLANVRPSGQFLMEDFYYAGGIRRCWRSSGRARPRLPDGQRPHARPRTSRVPRSTTPRSSDRLDDPVAKEATAILYGNLAPDGAVIKPSAADPRLLKHTGPALAFEGYDDDGGRDRRRRPRRHARPCAGAEERRARSGPACPNGACCRCRRSC